MNREWLMPAKILTGICALAVSSLAQTYTVSAKPGAVNYIQGDVTLNGDPVWTSNLKSTFLNANDVLAVGNGKAEVLLTPGVFLRLGVNSQIRMIRPSLVVTQLEIVSGESMIEVDDLVPGSSVAIMDHGSSTTLIKPGLYRFTQTSIAALDGKAEVAFGDRRIDLKKNKEVQIGETLTEKKVDLSEGDDLYAWSNTRAQYNAAATYAGSTQAYQAGGYGYSSYNSPGWYWNSPFNAYMWMPANGAFYSPFGWGFYGPGVVAYAPVIGMSFYGGGYGYGGYGGYGSYYGTVAKPVVKGSPTTTATSPTITKLPVKTYPAQMMVPVNPRNVGVADFHGSSPAAFAAARGQMQQAASFWGLRTASGAPAADLRGGQTFSNMHAASQTAASSARMASNSGWSGGGGRSSGGASGGTHAMSSGSGGFSGGSMSHAAGGGVSSGGGHSK